MKNKTIKQSHMKIICEVDPRSKKDDATQMAVKVKWPKGYVR